MGSLADVLSRAAPRLDELIPSRSTFSRLRAVAGRLPAELTRRVYLETWLGRQPPRVDLIVKVDRGERELLADPGLPLLDPGLRARPAWQGIGDFARAWSEPGSDLDAGARALWIELDLDPAGSAAAALRAPRLFVDFEAGAQRDPSPEARLRLALAVARVLSGSDQAPSAETLGRCLRHLPRGATLPYLGVFPRLGRAPVLRACVAGLGAALPAYLDAVAWPGDVDDLAREVLQPLARTQDPGAVPVSVLHLDLDPAVGPRIGFEYSFSLPGGRRNVPSEDAILEELVRRGWCLPGNRDALRSWPGRSVELLPHDVWHSRVTRRIGHIKVTCAPGQPVVAKAYLCLAFDLLAGGALLGSRPAAFGSSLVQRAPARGSRAMAPSEIVSSNIVSLQPRIRTASRWRAPDGTSIALSRNRLLGGTDMRISSAQQDALEKILARASVDMDFRMALLADPRQAILDGLGVRVPSGFRVKFVERDENVDALIVLPEFQRADGELSDADLESVAGGGDPTAHW